MSNTETQTPATASSNGAVVTEETRESVHLATKRAEETLDRAGECAGAWLAEASRWLRKSTALAREEAEDILAEAQSLRRKNMP